MGRKHLKLDVVAVVDVAVVLLLLLFLLLLLLLAGCCWCCLSMLLFPHVLIATASSECVQTIFAPACLAKSVHHKLNLLTLAKLV